MKNIGLATAFLSAALFGISPIEAQTPELPSTVSPEIQPGNNSAILEEMEKFLFEEEGIMDQVNHELLKEGYKTRTALIYYSKEDIQLKFFLVEKPATQSNQQKVKSIFYKLIEKNNLNPKAFTIEVGEESDGPDW